MGLSGVPSLMPTTDFYWWKMKTTLYLVLVIASLAFAVGRFLIETHPLSLSGTYRAFAHLFVGGLIGAWLASRDRKLLYMVVCLSVLELSAFFLSFLTR